MTEWAKTITKVITWIEDNITNDFSRNDLANHAGYSQFYLSRLFRLATGTTIKKYIADRRIYKAALDIKDTNVRIIDIAVKYGFSSQEALTRALKAAYGCTPHALRKNPHLNIPLTQKPVRPFENQKGEDTMSDYLAKSKKIVREFTKTTGFNHKLVCINIVSPAPKKLADFYSKVFNADICEDHGGPNRIEIWLGERNENTVCVVANSDEGFKPQSYNTCQGFEFRVLDADAEYKRILDLGIEIPEPPKNTPWGYRYFHIKDTDGNGIDIVAPL